MDQVNVAGGLAQANGIELCYETRGTRDDPALLLIMGFGVQLIDWDPGFCDAFVERGFFLVRFDNRDVGLSTKVDGIYPDLPACLRGDTSSAPYTLFDLADDVAGLLDALEIPSAHVVGASMGAQIAQCLAIRHPKRVRSLCSMMATTGDPTLPGPTPAAFKAIGSMSVTSRVEFIESMVAAGRVLAGPGFPYDDDGMRRRAAASFDRANHPDGRFRQAAAIAATGDRTEALRQLAVPSVVVHGATDPLVPVACAEATAATIPGARLVVIPGMGHEIPAGARPAVLEAIVANARRADSTDEPR